MSKLMSTLLTFFSLLTFLMIGGCSPRIVELTENGRLIQRLEDPSQFPQCRQLALIRVLHLNSPHNSYRQAYNDIRNRVANVKGTHLYIESSITNELTTEMRGVPYQCPLNETGQIKDFSVEQQFWAVPNENKQ